MTAKQIENIGMASKDEMKVTLSDLRSNSDLWYKVSKTNHLLECPMLMGQLHVLLHDLCNIANDRVAEARTLQTVDELYISAPYFTPEEAALIKAAVVSPPTLNEIPEFEALELEDDANTEIKEPTKEEAMTIEEAIKSCLQNFFEKRRASGDARPCGPHDMGPICKAVFGITTEDLKNEKFLGRLRRAGLSQPKEKAVNEESSNKHKKEGGNKG